MKSGGLFDELKHRNVIRVAVAYLIAGWVVLQVADLVKRCQVYLFQSKYKPDTLFRT